MAQPSVLQPLGGPLAGERLEFYDADVVIGSAPDCRIRVEAPGVTGYHARIMIDGTGATILELDGVVGVNDDLVVGNASLRSGDFLWLGEPGDASAPMMQFTLGDVGESASDLLLPAETVESLPDFPDEELPSDGFTLQLADDDALVEQPPAEVLEMETAPVPELMEAEPGLTLDEPPADLAFLEEDLDAGAPAEEEIVEEDLADQIGLEMGPMDVDLGLELEEPLQASLDELAPAVGAGFTGGTPTPPWQASPVTDAPEAAPEYASAWESAPALPPKSDEAPMPNAAPPDQPAVAPEAAPAASSPPPSPPRREPTIPPRPPRREPTIPPRPPRREPTIPPRGAVERFPAAPLRSTRTESSTPFVVGFLILLAVLAIAGYLLLGRAGS